MAIIFHIDPEDRRSFGGQGEMKPQEEDQIWDAESLVLKLNKPKQPII